MKEFPVGTVAILQNSVVFPELNGVEVTILEGLKEHNTKTLGRVVAYKTDLVHKNSRICPMHHQVRLKKFPPALSAWCNLTMLEVLQPLPMQDVLEIMDGVE